MSGVTWFNKNLTATHDKTNDFLVKFIINTFDNTCMMNLARHKIYFCLSTYEEDDYSIQKRKIETLYDEFFCKNKKLFKILYNALLDTHYTNIFSIHTCLNNFCPTVYGIYSVGGFNNAVYFIKKAISNEITISYDVSYLIEDVLKAIKEYSLNIKRLIEYLTDDFIKQGIDSIDVEIITTYIDYLRMAKGIYGVIDQKYPKNLKTMHDILSYKMRKIKRKLEANFEKIYDETYKDISSYQNEKYVILAPRNAKEVIDEGINLKHCVGSYINDIISNKKYIFFLREKSNIYASYITMEIDKIYDNTSPYKYIIKQIKSYRNSTTINSSVAEFLNDFCNDKNVLIIENIKVQN
ncbi:MAG: PcfJ domain-containing protein [Clostridia bacterium]|nr:PcfJ domain-containing protein [Clostridia bacterium]